MTLVLSLFPGMGLLDSAFEEEGFCVVRGPDLLWGGDIRRFHPPAGVFGGVIGGPPCQAWSSLVPIIRATGKRVAKDLIPEFERVVREAQPRWFVMENVIRAPIPAITGYTVDPTLLNNRWLGEKQNRAHRFSFGTREGLKLHYELSALEHPEFAYRVTTDARQQPVRLLAGKHPKRPRLAHRLSHEGPVLTVEDMCELQGLRRDFFAHSPFKRTAQRRMLGNAVPFKMGRALARAVKAALERVPCSATTVSEPLEATR